MDVASLADLESLCEKGGNVKLHYINCIHQYVYINNVSHDTFLKQMESPIVMIPEIIVTTAAP